MFFKSLLEHFGMSRDTKTGWTDNLPAPPSLHDVGIAVDPAVQFAHTCIMDTASTNVTNMMACCSVDI